MYLVKIFFQIFTREFHSYHVFNFLSGYEFYFYRGSFKFHQVIHFAIDIAGRNRSCISAASCGFIGSSDMSRRLKSSHYVDTPAY